MENCFAYDSKNGKFKCKVLTVKFCEGKACPFHRTEKECIHAEIETQKKLAELPPEVRERINKKYGV